MAEGPAFYFDLGSPDAYLLAERVLPAMPVATEWIPVLAAGLPAAESFEAFRCAEERSIVLGGVGEGAGPPGRPSLSGPAPVPLAGPVPVRLVVRDARADLRAADRADRPVRAGGVPPGVRGRSRAGRRRRADRGGGVRDAPGLGPQGGRPALGARGARARDGDSRGPRRTRRAGDRRRRAGLPWRRRPARRGPRRRRDVRGMRAKA